MVAAGVIVGVGNPEARGSGACAGAGVGIPVKGLGNCCATAGLAEVSASAGASNPTREILRSDGGEIFFMFDLATLLLKA